MATKLNLNSGGTTIGNKIIDIHQNNEYTKVNNYKEGMCFGCFGNNVVAALVSDICGDCARNIRVMTLMKRANLKKTIQKSKDLNRK